MYLTTILLFIKRFPHIIIHFSVFQNILIKTTEFNIVTFYAFLTDISVIKNSSWYKIQWFHTRNDMGNDFEVNVLEIDFKCEKCGKVLARFML